MYHIYHPTATTPLEVNDLLEEPFQQPKGITNITYEGSLFGREYRNVWPAGVLFVYIEYGV